jgi:diguanylate cyclase (GGDEF)-like protein
MSSGGTSEKTLQRRYWRLAAVLFIGGGLGAIPSDALHRPEHPPTIYLLPLLAIVSGLICLTLANRVSRRWLSLMTAIATLEIALTVWLTSSAAFAYYYLLIAFFAAYVFSDRRVIAGHFVFASVAALLPIAYDPATARETLEQGMTLIPTLFLTGSAIVFLRERLEQSELGYRRLAERDPLTGVGNYRVLSDRLPDEIERHRRYGHCLGVVVVDLDDFKRVNDEHGHLRGDLVLQEVAQSLMAVVRSHDVVIRHGGDEFAIIAPETDRGETEELAARMRRHLAQISVDGLSVGASTGCAVCPDDAMSVNGLLSHADQELRANKVSRPRGRRSAISADPAAALEPS